MFLYVGKREMLGRLDRCNIAATSGGKLSCE